MLALCCVGRDRVVGGVLGEAVSDPGDRMAVFGLEHADEPLFDHLVTENLHSRSGIGVRPGHSGSTLQIGRAHV